MKITKNSKLLIVIAILFSVSIFLLAYNNFKLKDEPNIILITIDALRPDHLGCYGYERNTSPNIDKLAEKGTLFLNTISAGPGSLPAMISLITSRYGPEHKVESWGDELSNRIATLSQVLKSHGIRTSFICGHYSIPGVFKNRENKDWDCLINYLSESDESNFFVVNNAERIVKDTKSWLKKNRFRQFFLWIHFMDPHAPYRPPEPYNKIYVDDVYYKGMTKVKLLSDEDWNSFGGIPKYMQLGKNNILDYYISQYDGEVKFVDENVRKIINYLKKSSLYDDTILMITADHGEAFGEYNYFGHDRLLYNTLIKVPLIISIPWLQNQKEKIASLVGTIDIAPTIVDLLKIEIPSDFRGESLVPLILGVDEDRNESFAFSSTGHGEKKFSIRSNKWKLIYDSKQELYELYNLREDGKESVDLIGNESRQFRILKMKLDKKIKKIFSKKKLEKQSLSKEEKARLRSLGYME